MAPWRLIGHNVAVREIRDWKWKPSKAAETDRPQWSIHCFRAKLWCITLYHCHVLDAAKITCMLFFCQLPNVLLIVCWVQECYSYSRSVALRRNAERRRRWCRHRRRQLGSVDSPLHDRRDARMTVNDRLPRPFRNLPGQAVTGITNKTNNHPVHYSE